MNYVILASVILFLLYMSKSLSKVSTDELAKAIFDQYMESGNPITMEEAVAIAKQAISVEMTPVEKRVMVYADIIMNEGYSQRMDPAAIAAVIHIESEGNPYAYRKEYDNGVHYATSYGLMQLLDPTANWLKKSEPSLKYNGLASKNTPGNLYDLGVNVEIGTYYLRYQFTRYNRLKYAFAGYNAGTCFVQLLGYVTECKTGSQGPFVNSVGNTNVNDHVTKVCIVLNRYRMIFAARYPEYVTMFPSSAYRI